MPTLVCSKCQRQLKPLHNGVYVVETFRPGTEFPQAYKIWQADEWECPECKSRTIAGFSDRAVEHFEVQAMITLLEHMKRNPTGVRVWREWTSTGMIDFTPEVGEKWINYLRG